MITLMLTTVFAMTPAYPDPDPTPPPAYGDILQLPTYMVNADGSRMQCSPAADYCWPDSSGLPSYLRP